MIQVDELKIGTYEDEHQSMLDSFSTLDEHRKTIRNIVNNGNWEGASYEMCQSVLAAVSDYLDNFNNDYTELASAVSELRTHVGSFVTESPSVQKLV